MPGGRKGFYEELQVKKYLSEITPKMFEHLKKILEGDDERRKDEAMHKILPKLIDKAIPTQLTGEEGNAIVIHVAREVAEAEKLYEPARNTEGDSQGSA